MGHRRRQPLLRPVQPPKKLSGAARHWAGDGAGGADEADDDAKAFGIDVGSGEPPDADYVVFPENWDAVRVFVAGATQWRIGPSGTATGLDYAGVRAVAAGLRVRWRDVFEGVRAMEGAALEVLDAPD